MPVLVFVVTHCLQSSHVRRAHERECEPGCLHLDLCLLAPAAAGSAGRGAAEGRHNQGAGGSRGKHQVGGVGVPWGRMYLCTDGCMLST